jgi:hypothetical protein
MTPAHLLPWHLDCFWLQAAVVIGPLLAWVKAKWLR